MTAAQSVSYSITVRLEGKLDRMGATGARYIASSDMSCLMPVQECAHCAHGGAAVQGAGSFPSPGAEPQRASNERKNER